MTSDLEDKVNYFLATKKLEGLSPATLKNYGYNLRKLCSFFNKPVSMITSADIKMFMYSESSTKGAAGMNTFMTPIKLFFVWLQNEEFIITAIAIAIVQLCANSQRKTSVLPRLLILHGIKQDLG